MTTILETKAKLAGSSKSLTIAKVNLNEVYADKDMNIRKVDQGAYDGPEFDDLKSSIKSTGGILTPLQVAEIDLTTMDADQVERLGEGVKYYLIAGFRRYYALSELAQDDEAFLTDVPVVISEAAENDEVVYKVTQTIENVMRKNLSPMETAEALDALKQEGLKQKEIASVTGMNESSVSQYFGLLDMPPDVKALLNSKRISFSHVREIQRTVRELKPKDDEAKATLLTQLAKAAKAKPFPDFKRFVDTMIEKVESGEGEVSDKDGVSVQRDQYTMRKATELDKKYLAKFREEWKKAKDANDKETQELWKVRADTVKFVLNMESVLAKDLEPWEEEQAKEEAEKKLHEDADKTKGKYIRELAAAARKRFTEIPEPGKMRPTLAECYAEIRTDLETKIAKGAEEGKSVADVFTFEFTVDDLMTEVKKAYEEKEESLQKAAAERAKKAAEKKAADEAQAAKDKAEGKEPEKKGKKKAKKEEKEDAVLVGATDDE